MFHNDAASYNQFRQEPGPDKQSRVTDLANARYRTSAEIAFILCATRKAVDTFLQQQPQAHAAFNHPGAESSPSQDPSMGDSYSGGPSQYQGSSGDYLGPQSMSYAQTPAPRWETPPASSLVPPPHLERLRSQTSASQSTAIRPSGVEQGLIDSPAR